MADRVMEIAHAGKQIVQIDFNGCTPGAFAPIIQDAKRTITSSPRGEVLALTLLQNIRFDAGTVLEMERFITAVQPYLKANALVGITGLKKVIFNGVKGLYRAPVELFDDPAAAKSWLASR